MVRTRRASSISQCFGPLVWIVFAEIILNLPLQAKLDAQEPIKPDWSYSADLMRPFWKGEVVEAESVLFIKDPKTGEAKASVLFPVKQMLAIRNSAGDSIYEDGRDFNWQEGSREIVLPIGSRIVSREPAELRRPAKSQMYELTHRDGEGEILFGAKLEYAEMQTCITYRREPEPWNVKVSSFDAKALPQTIRKLQTKQPLVITVIGDSISSGCNASAWAEGAPYQPAYPELLRRHLEHRFQSEVMLVNLSVSGTDTNWGLSMIERIVEPRPDLVIIAFGMNDSAMGSANDYRAGIEGMLLQIQEQKSDVEFILIASMLANRDWVRLHHEAFPLYRDVLASLCRTGVAMADLTTIWAGLLEFKQDWDLTGNGVNHPNDFGHRIYAQVISELLSPEPAQ